MVGFLEIETPASASSDSSKLSADLMEVWPHRLRPLLTPVTLFSALEGAALCHRRGKITFSSLLWFVVNSYLTFNICCSHLSKITGLLCNYFAHNQMHIKAEIYEKLMIMPFFSDKSKTTSYSTIILGMNGKDKILQFFVFKEKVGNVQMDMKKQFNQNSNNETPTKRYPSGSPAACSSPG